MTLALTQKSQIAVFEVRDTNEVISLKQRPCLISTNLKDPRNLCYVKGYLMALDQFDKFLCCDLETQMVFQSQRSQKQDSVTEEVATEAKPEEGSPDGFSAKTFALKLRNKRFEIEFESVETPSRFKEISATRKKLFLLSELGDVFRLDIQNSEKKPLLETLKRRVLERSTRARLSERGRKKRLMPGTFTLTFMYVYLQ